MGHPPLRPTRSAALRGRLMATVSRICTESDCPSSDFCHRPSGAGKSTISKWLAADPCSFFTWTLIAINPSATTAFGGNGIGSTVNLIPRRCRQCFATASLRRATPSLCSHFRALRILTLCRLTLLDLPASARLYFGAQRSLQGSPSGT